VFAAGDFGAAETATDRSFDTFGSALHGATHRLLHGAAEGHTFLELLGDVLSDQLSFGINGLDLIDVDEELAAELGDEFLLEVFNASALATNDDARLAGRNLHEGLFFALAFDLDAGYASFEAFGFHEIADLLVFNEEFAEIFLVGVPAGVPIFDNANAQAVGIDFLAHSLPSLISFLENDRDVAGSLVDTCRAAAGLGDDALEHRALVGIAVGDIECIAGQAVVVDGVGLS